MKGESMKRMLEKHPHMHQTPEHWWRGFWSDVLMALGLLGAIVAVVGLALYLVW